MTITSTRVRWKQPRGHSRVHWPRPRVRSRLHWQTRYSRVHWAGDRVARSSGPDSLDLASAFRALAQPGTENIYIIYKIFVFMLHWSWSYVYGSVKTNPLPVISSARACLSLSEFWPVSSGLLYEVARTCHGHPVRTMNHGTSFIRWPILWLKYEFTTSVQFLLFLQK